MINIDGSSGEGGGQILRTALALSLVTGRAFRITRIRAGRRKPGLLRQHLTAVEAALEVGQGKAEGAELGSQQLQFEPGTVKAGQYHFAVGTAGSATLVLQTVLPALLVGTEASFLTLEGGTHNPHAPPFDFLEKAFLPLIQRMGPRVSATLLKPGFYPAGGGKFSVRIDPAQKLVPLELRDRGPVTSRLVRALVANLSPGVGERELTIIREQMNWPVDWTRMERVAGSRGPGNVVMAEIQSESVTEVFSGFGERGVPAESVATDLVSQIREYLLADVPVGCHLADQLLIPMALARGGCFATHSPSRHTRTNLETIQRFLDVSIHLEREGDHRWILNVN